MSCAPRRRCGAPPSGSSTRRSSSIARAPRRCAPRSTRCRRRRPPIGRPRSRCTASCWRPCSRRCRGMRSAAMARTDSHHQRPRPARSSSGSGRAATARMQLSMPDVAPGAPRQTVLVLQGGGALGAYQVGVYQALHERGIEPDWVIGTSIGAINAGLIAGNEPRERLDRLEEFWRRMKRKEFWGLANWPGLADTTSYWSTLFGGIPGFFEPNPLAFLGAHYPLGRDSAGFYSTAPLAKTLTELVDFTLIERCTPRLTVGAAHVRTSEMRYFDSRETAVTVRHVMASGALPPAFPAIRIDGELYWDGGILSNTPTEAVFDDNPRRNSLIFAVHLWNPSGDEPATMKDVLNRHKDVQYSSRIASHI